MKNKNLLLLPIILAFCFSSQCLLAGKNNPDDFKPTVLVGSCKIEKGYFETEKDGQLFLQKSDDFELRLKQNTVVTLSKNPLALTDELLLKKGLIGVKVLSDTLLIKTDFADLRLRNATVTVRVTDHLVRVCVIEGTAIFIKGTNFIPVEAGNEIAASKDKLSKIYKYLDDLRYVWYWKPFDEEPSLKD